MKPSKPDQNIPFEKFALAFKEHEHRIKASDELLPESSIPHELLTLPLDALMGEAMALQKRMNQLRSAYFYALRRRAYEEKISMELAFKNAIARENAKKETEQRAKLASQLKGADKRMFKRTGLLPREFKSRVMEIVRLLDSEKED